MGSIVNIDGELYFQDYTGVYAEVKIVVKESPFLVIIIPYSTERDYEHFAIYGPSVQRGDDLYDHTGLASFVFFRLKFEDIDMEIYHLIGGLRNENNMSLALEALKKTWIYSRLNTINQMNNCLLEMQSD